MHSSVYLHQIMLIARARFLFQTSMSLIDRVTWDKGDISLKEYKLNQDSFQEQT